MANSCLSVSGYLSPSLSVSVSKKASKKGRKKKGEHFSAVSLALYFLQMGYGCCSTSQDDVDPSCYF